MSQVEDLISVLTEAGLTFGRPATAGAPEVRVRSESGREYAVRALHFSFMVIPCAEPVMVQCLSAEDVISVLRGSGAARTPR